MEERVNEEVEKLEDKYTQELEEQRKKMEEQLQEVKDRITSPEGSNPNPVLKTLRKPIRKGSMFSILSERKNNLPKR